MLGPYKAGVECSMNALTKACGREYGSVGIPQEAFIAALRMGEE
jgi:hypothetical protein